MKHLYQILTALLVIVAVVLTAQAALGAGLDLTNVAVSGQSVSSAGTLAVKHLDQRYTLTFDITNTDTQTARVNFEILVDGKNVYTSTPASDFSSNETKPFSLSLPAMTLGTRSVNIIAKDYGVESKHFPFSLNIGVPTKIKIESLTFDNAQMACNSVDRTLNILYSNYGNTPSDVTINLIGAVNKSVIGTIGAGDINQPASFTITNTELTPGTYPFTVEIVYEDGLKVTGSPVSLTKLSCISGSDPVQGTSVTLDNTQSKVFTATTLESKVGTWQIGTTTFSGNSFTLDAQSYSIGDYTLTFTVGEKDSISWPVKITQHVDVPTSLQVSSLSTISLAQSDLGKTLTKTVTLSNLGTLLPGVTGLVASSSSSAVSVSLSATSISPQDSIDATLSIVVPSTLTAGESILSTVTFKADNNLSATLPVKVNYASLLKITDVELNGDNDGEFTFDETNTFDVTVENSYTNDLEDVTVTVTIKDVDDDDLEEESESFDLDQGDDDTISITFDLSSEELIEEDYTVEITVEGRDVDDHSIKQTASETQIFSVSRDTHKVILKNVDLSSTLLQCLKQTDLKVEVENVGKSNEDAVEIKVKNTALGIDFSRKDINLDKYSGDDNKYETAFSLETENAKAGTYALSIEVYVDDDLEDSTSVNLEVKDCGSVTSGSGTYNADVLAAQLQKQLQTNLEAKKAANQEQSIVPVTASGFRDTNTYLALLVGLSVLLVLGIVLGLATFSKRK